MPGTGLYWIVDLNLLNKYLADEGKRIPEVCINIRDEVVCQLQNIQYTHNIREKGLKLKFKFALIEYNTYIIFSPQ